MKLMCYISVVYNKHVFRTTQQLYIYPPNTDYGKLYG